ncbi:vWA domain-containing protein [Desmospora activa]|uniref:Ca-activated chloride channel family protein n=1 Tax=Desmospora activa DSM 45169 TaxID=1121389 RepID=A0A2T4ZDT0_9BACL|nr:VWA domain-containing protein [Desmospora activa]PTM60016.1 Ca-activated chloride channel family protein [Desmospora activa DSM 45169]
MLDRVRLSMVTLLCIALIGCNSPVNNAADNDESREKNFAKTQSIEDILTAKPGTFAGDKYNVKKIEQELKKHDKMNPDEAFALMLSYVAEDYRPFKKRLDAFDTEHRLSDQPDIAAGIDFVPEQLNVAILLDASGSMAGQVPGGVKMDLAKEAVNHFASNLPEGTNVSLRIYGHKGSNSEKDKAVSCDSNEVIYEAHTYDDRFQQVLDNVKPIGWTPLAAAIKSAKDDLSANSENARNLVYVVSDGEETCGGDPIKEAKHLNQSNIQAMVNIIGFDVDDKGQKELKEVAEAGGGVYETVDTGEDLQAWMENERLKIDAAWEQWKNDNYYSVAEQNSDKHFDLMELEDHFYEVLSREEGRFYKLAMMMEDMNLIEDNNKIDEWIESRGDELDQYISEYLNQLDQDIEKDDEKTTKELEEKAP